MKVLILGASGFIGSAVAHGFVRAGHIVYGQTRSQHTADVEFAPNEILPIVCDPHSEQGRVVWSAVAKDVDVVVDTLAAAGAEKALAIYHTFLSAISGRPKWAPRATYIYCGGHYVMARGYGGLDKWSDERQPADAPVNKGTIWRADIEDPVLHNEHINGIVINPTCLYGRSGSYFAFYHFQAALDALSTEDKVFETICSNDAKILTIHHDDLADLFVRVAERGPICRGQVFLAANQSTDSLRDILDAVVRVSGCKGYKVKEVSDAYETAWITPLLAKATLGHALTGWTPKKMSLSDGMDIYWPAFVASVRKAKN